MADQEEHSWKKIEGLPIVKRIEHAEPGYKVTIPTGRLAGTWIRIEDLDPPYTSKMWANIRTGAVIGHWSAIAHEAVISAAVADDLAALGLANNPEPIPAHPPDACAGHHCPFHNPSDHHMKDWPKSIRASGMTERHCEHGVGHPDPDALAFFAAQGHVSDIFGIHGCDGCCHPPDHDEDPEP